MRTSSRGTDIFQQKDAPDDIKRSLSEELMLPHEQAPASFGQKQG
jgi:hypothetical protein